MLERFLLLWLLLSSGVAYYWDESFATMKLLLPSLITVTMFSIGLMLPRDEVRQVFERWPAVFGGTAIQYAVMPLLAFSMGKAFGLTGDAFIGIVVVGCVPGRNGIQCFDAERSRKYKLLSKPDYRGNTSIASCCAARSGTCVAK